MLQCTCNGELLLVSVVIELAYFIVTDYENRQTNKAKQETNKNQTQCLHHEFGACQKFCKFCNHEFFVFATLLTSLKMLHIKPEMSVKGTLIN